MKLYGHMDLFFLSDIKSELKNAYDRLFKSADRKLLKNENEKGEPLQMEYHAFTDEEAPRLSQYIKHRYLNRASTEPGAYRDMSSLMQLPFISQLAKKSAPVFCYGHFGTDDVQISKDIAWTVERLHMYGKLKNEYGSRITQRICVVADEANRYSEGGRKDIAVSRERLKDFTSRGRSDGFSCIFINQTYKTVAKPIRDNCRYTCVAVGFPSNDDADLLFKEVGITNRDERAFYSNLRFDVMNGIRECLLFDKFEKTVKKFIPLSPLCWNQTPVL